MRNWALFYSDPEMQTIENLLRSVGEKVCFAVDDHGKRVHGGNAYTAFAVVDDDNNIVGWDTVTHMVEGDCKKVSGVKYIDHHKPGDYGYGKPPRDFLPASSLGQVIAELAKLNILPKTWKAADSSLKKNDETIQYNSGWMVLSNGVLFHIPHELVIVAAADHCLGAAYKYECPGVDPDDVMTWRAKNRADFQNRSVEEVLADIKSAQEQLRKASKVVLYSTTCEWHAAKGTHADNYFLGDDCLNIEGTEFAENPCESITVCDMRRETPIRELPEAAMRLGVGYISGPLITPDGKKKITCSGSREQIAAFLNHWAAPNNLVDCYGDPERGFAGGYLI